MNALLLISLVMTHPADGTWVKFAPERGGFTIMMPGKPVVTKQTAEKTEVDHTEAALAKGSCRYVVRCSRVQQRTLDVLPAESIIELTIRTFLDKHGSRLIVDTKVALEKTTIRKLFMESRCGFLR